MITVLNPPRACYSYAFFPHGGTESWASSYNYTATQSESDEPKKPFDAKVRAPAKTIPVTKSTMPSSGCFSPPLNGVVFPKRGSHYARNRIRLDGLGGAQKQHVCLNKSKAERGFTSLSSFHWNSKTEAHNQPIKEKGGRGRGRRKKIIDLSNLKSHNSLAGAVPAVCASQISFLEGSERLLQYSHYWAWQINWTN